MLIDGPYPWPLKQRIRGRTGHLSNDDTAVLLESLQHDHLAHVVLAHLSEENNTPEKAEQTVRSVLERFRYRDPRGLTGGRQPCAGPWIVRLGLTFIIWSGSLMKSIKVGTRERGFGGDGG
jgi:hypothetical protein